MQSLRPFHVAGFFATVLLLSACDAARPAIEEDRSETERERSTTTNPPTTNPQEKRKGKAASTITHDYRRIAHKALVQPVTVSYERTPLREVIADLAARLELTPWIDEAEITDEGVDFDQPIDQKVEQAPIRFVLDRVLHPHGLAWLVDEGVLHITSEVAAEERFTTVMYDLLPLLETGAEPEMLTDTLLLETAGPWQETEGVGGTFSIVRDVLVVRHNRRVHDEVQSLLNAFVEIASGNSKRGRIPVRPPGYPFEADAAAEAALAKPITVDFEGVPLNKAIATIAERTGVKFELDIVALMEQGTKPDVPIELHVARSSAAETIDRLLDPLRGTWLLREGRVVVTSRAAAAEVPYTVVHDVRDLANGGYSGTFFLDMLITSTKGPWRDLDGEGGTIAEPMHGTLVVRNTDRSHADVDRVIASLRTLLRHRGGPVADPEIPGEMVVELYSVSIPRSRPADVAEAIRSFVAPTTWTDSPDGNRIRAVGHTIVVRHERRVQHEIAEFLKRLQSKRPEAVQMSGSRHHIPGHEIQPMSDDRSPRIFRTP